MNEKTVYALGFFDGLHLGHAALMAACRSLADSLGCRAGVVTFANHPDTLVLGTTPGLINTTCDREKMLREQFHIDTIVSLPFDRELMERPWQEFYRFVVDTHNAAGLVCGDDFRFGDRGRGTAQGLAQICAQDGIPCQVIPQVWKDGAVVSSTRIRALIELGQMGTAVELLGHPYVLTGLAEPCPRYGVPGLTAAKIMLPKELVVPKFGLYVCRCRVDGNSYEGVAHVGTQPTAAGIGITVAPWVIDCPVKLAGREITLEFYKFLRPDRNFRTREALGQDILRNTAIAREFFRKEKP